MILEAFEAYCRRRGITSEQYKEEIFPVFAEGFATGQRAMKKLTQDHLTYHALTRRGNPS